MTQNAIIVRFGEIFLKRQRKRYFLERLVTNLRLALAEWDDVKVNSPHGRVMVTLKGPKGECPPPFEENLEPILDAIGRVFGIESFSPAVLCEPDLDVLHHQVAAAAERALQRHPGIRTFKVDTRRVDKSFPMSSTETNALLGGAVLAPHPELKVDLGKPDLTVGVEIHPRYTAVHAESLPGPGGLPVGSNGKALLLLSGGIDSPVAGWRIAKRGVQIDGLYFHAFPYTGDQTKEKVVALARELARWQGPMRLHIVEFAAFQKHCRDNANGRLLVLLYRRQMIRIAEVIAKRRKHLALVTGESVGQVASQTLHNIHSIGCVTDLPIIRPLVGNDKQETITLARTLGTYPISIQPFDDCCSLFVPRHPETRARPEQLEAAEEALDLETHLLEALDSMETLEIVPTGHA
jgi:thiamine biosynthesis protein ThiI